MNKALRFVGVFLFLAGIVSASLSTHTATLAQGDGDAPFTVEATSFESQYPHGMVFTLAARSEAGDIVRVGLIYRFQNGADTHEEAEFDEEQGVWVAHIFNTGGLPPWVGITYAWRLRDSEGNVLETEPQAAVYEDHTREWSSIETDDILFYWFDVPDEIGPLVAEAMEAMRPHFIAGWGGTLSYKPLAVLFPEGDVWNEFQPSAPDALGIAYFGSVTVQRFIPADLGEFERYEECIARWSGTELTMETRLRGEADIIIHETTHMYQSDFESSYPTPLWWFEGQADYFASLWEPFPDDSWPLVMWDSAARLTNYLSVTGELPTLQGDTLGYSDRDADGCLALAYNVGSHFIGWLLGNYGGLETHRQIVELLQDGRRLSEALEEATGVSFVELETQWRATWGLGPAAPPPTLPPVTLPTFPMGGATPQPGN